MFTHHVTFVFSSLSQRLNLSFLLMILTLWKSTDHLFYEMPLNWAYPMVTLRLCLFGRNTAEVMSPPQCSVLGSTWCQWHVFNQGNGMIQSTVWKITLAVRYRVNKRDGRSLSRSPLKGCYNSLSRLWRLSEQRSQLSGWGWRSEYEISKIKWIGAGELFPWVKWGERGSEDNY